MQSIKRLKEVIKGTVNLQVMLIRSKDGKITNIESKRLRSLLDAILDVEPDQVQPEVPYRPPSESFVKPPPREEIKLFFDELSKKLGKDRLWVYGLHDKRGKSMAWLSHESLEREAVELLKRRPCRVVDISAFLGIDFSDARRLLRKLREKLFIVAETSKGEIYYSHRLPQ